MSYKLQTMMPKGAWQYLHLTHFVISKAPVLLPWVFNIPKLRVVDVCQPLQMTVQWVSVKTNVCDPLFIKYIALVSDRGVRKGGVCVYFHGQHNLIFWHCQEKFTERHNFSEWTRGQCLTFNLGIRDNLFSTLLWGVIPFVYVLILFSQV